MSQRRKKSNKKIMVLVFLLAVAVGSSSLILLVPPVEPKQVKTLEEQYQISNINLTKYVELAMQNVPLDCYSFYQDGTKSSDHQVQYYKELIKGLYNNTYITNPGTFTQNPSFAAYLLEHCNYVDTSKKQLPKTFDPSLYSGPPIGITPLLKQRLQVEQQLTNYNFTAIALKEDRIETTADFFHMTLPEVIQHIFSNHVLSLSDCINPSWRNQSTIRECTLNQSHFVINNTSGELMGILDKPPVKQPTV